MNESIALQPPVGTIALQESRQTVTNIADFYRRKYKELLERKDKIEKDYQSSKTGIAVSGTAAKIALTFTPTLVKGLGRLAINLGAPIINWINGIKSNQSKKEIDRQMETLKQDYARETGEEINIDPVEEQGGKTL